MKLLRVIEFRLARWFALAGLYVLIFLYLFIAAVGVLVGWQLIHG